MKDKQPKMTRKERERRMIAEMESAYGGRKTTTENDEENSAENTAERGAKQTAGSTQKQAKREKQSANSTPNMHCPRCRTLMENGKCPTCGHYVYVPMDKEKRNKIRLIVGGICMVGFVILFVLLQLNK